MGHRSEYYALSSIRASHVIETAAYDICEFGTRHEDYNNKYGFSLNNLFNQVQYNIHHVRIHCPRDF